MKTLAVEVTAANAAKTVHLPATDAGEVFTLYRGPDAVCKFTPTDDNFTVLLSNKLRRK
jgi:hypothetical protein